MTLNAVLQQARKDLEKTVADAKPVHAVVGATDLAAHQIRAAGDRFGTARIDVKSVPGKAQQVFGDVVTAATSTYDDLAGRGKDVLSRVSKQEAVRETERQARTTASKAKATATTAKRSASSTRSAAKGTRTSAKKTARSATKAAKSTARSAGKPRTK